MATLRIRQKASDKKAKIAEIAAAAECTPQMMNNYLNETHGIPLDKLIKIADFLGCAVFELLEVDDRFDHLYTGNGEWLGIRKK